MLQRDNVAIFLDRKLSSRLRCLHNKANPKCQSLIVIRNVTSLVSSAPTHYKSENRQIIDNVCVSVDDSKMYISTLPVPASPKLISNIRTYTTSTAFFEALWDVRGLPTFEPHGYEHSRNSSAEFYDPYLQAGVAYCFINLGSDHPSILDVIAQNSKEPNGRFPNIITCPHEVGYLSRDGDLAD